MYHEHLMCVTLCVCVCVCDRESNLVDKVADCSLFKYGCWSFPLWPYLFHSPSLRILFSLKIVLGALQKGILKGHQRVAVTLLLLTVMYWNGQRDVACKVWTLVLIWLAIKDVKWCWGTHNKPLMSTHQHIHVRFSALGCLFLVRK